MDFCIGNPSVKWVYYDAVRREFRHREGLADSGRVILLLFNWAIGGNPPRIESQPTGGEQLTTPIMGQHQAVALRNVGSINCCVKEGAMMDFMEQVERMDTRSKVAERQAVTKAF